MAEEFINIDGLPAATTPLNDADLFEVLQGGVNKKVAKSELGGTATLPVTSYASNADAVAALGVGKLYKSTTLINGSPIILITQS